MSRGMTTREDDVLQDLLVADTHDMLLFFTNRGRAYPLRGFGISGDTSRTSRGTSLANLVPLSDKERVNATIAVTDLQSDGVLVMATRLGEVKVLNLSSLAGIRAAGLIVMDLEEGDELVSVRRAQLSDEIMMVTAQGMAVHFVASQVPRRSRGCWRCKGYPAW